MIIVFSTDQVYRHGGVEKVMAEKANYFSDVLGYEVYILTTEQHGNPPCYQLSERIKMVDLQIAYQREKSYFSLENLKKIPAHFNRLRSTLKELKPDFLIVCNLAFDYYWLPFTAKQIVKFKEFHSSRYFHHIERLDNKNRLKQLFYKWNDWVEARYDRLLVLNPDEKKFYQSANITVIPNPVEIPVQLTAALQSKFVLAAGRIAPVKGFEYLIEAWKLVSNQNNGWKLHIYGEDYLGTKEKLVSLLQQYHLEDQVVFMGTTEKMTVTMLDYSIYAMTSVTECFPMVLLESLSVGLPAVSFDSPTGPANIITQNEDGFLVDYMNVALYAEKLLALMQNEEKRAEMGKAAKHNANRFSNEIVMAKWRNLLLEFRKNV